MKTFLKVIAWIGAGFMFLSILIILDLWLGKEQQTPSPYPMDGVDFSGIIIIPMVIIAFLFMLLGGLIGRPKYFWPVSIALGFAYLGTFSPSVQETISRIQHTKPVDIDTFDIQMIVFCILPGLMAIVEGVLLRTMGRKAQRRI